MTGLSAAEREALETAFLVGLGRQPLAVPALAAGAAENEVALACLGLLAQRRRFDRPRPVPPPPAAPRTARDDGRAILEAEAGRLLQRFVAGCVGAHAAPLLEAAVARLAASGRRPHPFQVGRFLAALKKQGCGFGPREQAYLAEIAAVVEPAAPAVADLGAIDAGNWTGFPRQIRVQFIAALRLRDPAAARQLVASTLAAEPANVRAELVGALGSGIGPDDRAFLEGLAGDRAQTVRDAAARLLSRVPGTPSHGERVARAVAALRVTPAGLVPVDQGASVLQLETLFDGLTVEAVAERFASSSTDFIVKIAPAAEALLLALAQLAASTGRLDLVTPLIAAARSGGGSWTRYTSILAVKLSGAPDEARSALIAALAPFGNDPFPRAADWRALARLCGGPLPPALAAPILESTGCQAFLESLGDEASPRRHEVDADLAAFAAVLPAPTLSRLVDAIGPAAPVAARVVAAFAAFATAL